VNEISESGDINGSIDPNKVPLLSNNTIQDERRESEVKSSSIAEN